VFGRAAGFLEVFVFVDEGLADVGHDFPGCVYETLVLAGFHDGGGEADHFSAVGLGDGGVGGVVVVEIHFEFSRDDFAAAQV